MRNPQENNDGQTERMLVEKVLLFEVCNGLEEYRAFEKW